MCFRPPSRSNAPGRACAALALALLAGAAHPGAAAAQAASDARSEVERFERVLDAAVASVSQPRVLPLLGGAGGARGFLVPGVGVVFVLPPQALPGPRRALVLRRGASRAHAAAEPETVPADDARPRGLTETLREAQQARTEQALRQREQGLLAAQEAEARRQARAARESLSDLERELREVEELALAYQREVERMRGQGERALFLLTEALREGQQEIRIPLGPVATAAPPEAPAPPAPPGAPPVPDTQAPAPPAPFAPWRYWFEVGNEEASDTVRSPEDLVGAVRSVIIDTIEGRASLPRAVRPDEHLVVAVDFVPTALVAGAPAPQARRLVVKVRKRDIEEHRAGRLSRAQLRERIDVTEY